MPQARTESECTVSSMDDEEVMLFPLCEVGLPEMKGDDIVDENPESRYLTLRQRRQIKLGIQKAYKLSPDEIKILPLNVLIPKAKITDKNRKWYEALKKVWYLRDPWSTFHLDTYPEKDAVRHRYDPIKQKWHKDNVKVKMEDTPFNRGAMRQCFRLKKLSKFCKSSDWSHAGNYVAKKYMESVDRSVYFEDVKLQMDAKLWAEEYNRHNPPKKIDIFQMYIIELVNDEGSPLYHLEHFIEGEYIKYNSNSGFVEETVMCRYTPQAFSHFSFERSGHELIVVDIQGVGDLYTDPQIHTMDGLMYGSGNLGTKGMALFFNSHECNDICRALGLEPFDLSPAEIKGLSEHHFTSPSETCIRGMEDHVVSPNEYDRKDLRRMLSNPSRQRSTSTMSDLGSTAEEEEETSSPSPRSSSEDIEIHKLNVMSQLSVDSGVQFAIDSTFSSRQEQDTVETIHAEHKCACHQRQHLLSVSSDDYPYDTSECSSSVPSHSASLTRAIEQKMFGFKSKRSCSTEAENLLRNTAEFHLGDSILGQVHHDLAKYHEIGRFAENGEESKIDWDSALFHEEIAAKLGVKDAILTMAKIYLGLPHDILVSCEVPSSEENINKGVEFMSQAAYANDRAAIVYMAKAYQTGVGLGTAEEKSYAQAVEFYQRAVQTQDNDDHGEYDATMADPNYSLLAIQAELYLAGGFGLEKDPSRAGELYTEAADEAMAAMKGRLANQYYMKAEEAWSEVE